MYLLLITSKTIFVWPTTLLYILRGHYPRVLLTKNNCTIHSTWKNRDVIKADDLLYPHVYRNLLYIFPCTEIYHIFTCIEIYHIFIFIYFLNRGATHTPRTDTKKGFYATWSHYISEIGRCGKVRRLIFLRWPVLSFIIRHHWSTI